MKNKIRNGLVGIVLGASLAFGTMKAYAGGEEFENFLGDLSAEGFKQQGATGVGNAIQRSIDADRMKAAMEAGKSEININNNGGNQNSDSEQQKEENSDGRMTSIEAYNSGYFACAGWDDKNKDDKVGVDEFYGAKKRWRLNEKLMLVGIFGDLSRKYEGILKVSDSQNNVIYTESYGKDISNKIVGLGNQNSVNLLNRALRIAGVGTYTANWHIRDDMITGHYKFEIYDSTIEDLAKENQKLKEQLRIKNLMEENARLKAQLEAKK